MEKTNEGYHFGKNSKTSPKRSCGITKHSLETWKFEFRKRFSFLTFRGNVINPGFLNTNNINFIMDLKPLAFH